MLKKDKMNFTSIKQVVKSGNCLGCGLCTINLKDPTKDKVKYSKYNGIYEPNLENIVEDEKINLDICPGSGYKIKSQAEQYSLGNNYDPELGYYDSLKTTQSKDQVILKNAASSGIMTSLVQYMISKKIVDKAIVTKFIYTDDGPRSSTFATNNLDELIDAQGSKYCPVDLSEVIQKLSNSNEKYIYLGTPCQISGLKRLQNNGIDLNIKFFVGNFCGGFKSYNNLNKIIKIAAMKPKNITFFRFRGGGQPGSLKIDDNKGNTAQIDYPEYVKMTGYSKMKRCHFCVDATAELADFACGDAWLKEYTDTKIPTSIVISRNSKATEIIEAMTFENIISSSDISSKKVIDSQIGNISTKKHRMANRLKLYRFFGYRLPEIEEGFDIKSSKSLMFELNVMVSHKVKFIFEKIGLFYFVYYKNSFFKKVFFRLFKDNYN